MINNFVREREGDNSSELPVIEINNDDLMAPEKDLSPVFSLDQQSIETRNATKEQEFQDSIVKILTNEKKKKSELFIFSKREQMIRKLQRGSFLTEEVVKNIVNNSYKRVFPNWFNEQKTRGGSQKPRGNKPGLISQYDDRKLLVLPPPETSALALNRTSGISEALHPAQQLPHTYVVPSQITPLITQQPDGQNHVLPTLLDYNPPDPNRIYFTQ